MKKKDFDSNKSILFDCKLTNLMRAKTALNKLIVVQKIVRMPYKVKDAKEE